MANRFVVVQRLRRLIRNFISGSNCDPDVRSDYYHHKKLFFEAFSRHCEFVFVGDSLTCNAEWQELFPGLDVVNRGVISDRTDCVLNRIDSILSTHAQTAFVMIGFNDIHQGFPVSHVFKNYRRIVELLVKNGMNVFVQSTLFAGAKHSSLNSQIGDLNNLLAQMCEETDNATYIELNDAMAIDGLLHSEYSRDGVHLNGFGYGAWRGAIQHLVAGAQISAPDSLLDC